MSLQTKCEKWGCQGGQLCLDADGWNLCTRLATLEAERDEALRHCVEVDRHFERHALLTDKEWGRIREATCDG